MTIGDKILPRHLTDLERADRAEAEAFRPGFARLPKDRTGLPATVAIGVWCLRHWDY